MAHAAAAANGGVSAEYYSRNAQARSKGSKQTTSTDPPGQTSHAI